MRSTAAAYRETGRSVRAATHGTDAVEHTLPASHGSRSGSVLAGLVRHARSLFSPVMSATFHQGRYRVSWERRQWAGSHCPSGAGRGIGRVTTRNWMESKVPCRSAATRSAAMLRRYFCIIRARSE